MTRLVVSGGSIVLPDRVIDDGCLIVEGEWIAAIEPRTYRPSGDDVFVDAHGRLVMPGLIDLHNDGLESEINPRPGVNLPVPFALTTLDPRLAASGVTTELHAVFFASMTRKQRKLEDAPMRVRAILDHAESGRALADHRVLFRVDLWSEDSVEHVIQASADVPTPLISLNDHTPGQGQYRDVEVFKRYFRDALGRSHEEADRDAEHHMAVAREHPEIAAAVIARVRELARTRAVVLLSHDDDSPERVDQMYGIGARVAEFPVTFEAAERQRELGMTIVAGAPNVVRGGSASGNISAVALLERGLVDVLCADYHAPSLILATWKVVLNGVLSLPEAVRLITLNPARAARLDGAIGSLEVGKQADLVVIDPSGPVPTVEMTVRAGQIRYHTPSRTATLAAVR